MQPYVRLCIPNYQNYLPQTAQIGYGSCRPTTTETVFLTNWLARTIQVSIKREVPYENGSGNIEEWSLKLHSAYGNRENSGPDSRVIAYVHFTFKFSTQETKSVEYIFDQCSASVM